MNLKSLNALPAAEASQEFLKCCGSSRWAAAMTERRPYESLDELTRAANDMWWALEQSDWLEAFHSHPRIGERLGEKKAADRVSAQSKQWSGQEQAGVQIATQKTLDSLAQLNQDYEQKFGFIFIVCATGKSAAEMLELLRERVGNEPDAELRIASAEQAKITEIRLKKLVH
ncbi:MAG TPA: 2-oxo-4-hydroxy-4-carboxy-5-ureidoimidazoline decarboxylase [Pyrinomonadaceae bacterium]|nr:2-oxo-4-hydroxy-4-carboxy-5-ureidoimidazoline decarboxylase [Pyrinomonadaceae bacterium]